MLYRRQSGARVGRGSGGSILRTPSYATIRFWPHISLLGAAHIPLDLRCEDIYAGLVSVQADMTWRRMLTRGVELPLRTKLISGVMPVVLLVLTLVGPLIYFSDINVSNPLVHH